MKKTISAVIVALLGLALSACNTVQGIGKDVQKGGQIIQDAAKK